MKLQLLLTNKIDEEPFNRLYLPGYIFEVEVTALSIKSNDSNINGLTLDEGDLKNFRLLGEVKDA